jgi:hypothetical protein
MKKSINAQKFKVVNILLNKSSLFDENVIHLILNYYWLILENKHKVLLEWIPIEKLDWNMLSLNPNAIDLLNENDDKIFWHNMTFNPNVNKLLKNKDKNLKGKLFFVKVIIGLLFVEQLIQLNC